MHKFYFSNLISFNKNILLNLQLLRQQKLDMEHKNTKHSIQMKKKSTLFVQLLKGKINYNSTNMYFLTKRTCINTVIFLNLIKIISLI